MNIWQYFDNRSKRTFVKKQLKYYRDERRDHTLMWSETRGTELERVYLDVAHRLDAKISYYENKLNDLL